jgi:hypothetical protein
MFRLPRLTRAVESGSQANQQRGLIDEDLNTSVIF